MSEREIVSVGADVDVEQLMGEIRATVERRKEAGEYPPDVLAEIELDAKPDDPNEAFKRVLADLHRTSGFTAEITTESSKAVVAPVVSKTKSAIRTGLRWYLTGILQQIGAFSGNVVRATRMLGDRTASLESRAEHTDHRLDELERFPLGDLRSRLEALEDVHATDRLARLDRALRDLRERVESAAAAGAGSEAAGAPPPPSAAARTWDISKSLDYFEFENRFRGSEEEIARRQRVYLDAFRDVPGRVVDLGCGRGEFLGILAEEGIDGYGVDRHPDMVLRGQERGLEIVQGEALGHLDALEPGSLGGIFSAQMVEHLEPKEVPPFFELAAKALAPGGVLVVETINPGSLFVFAHAFYVDLEHLRPLHHVTLKFLAEAAGFAEVRTEFLAPPPDDFRPQELPRTGVANLDGVLDRVDENFRRIDDILFGPQDYAVIAVR